MVPVRSESPEVDWADMVDRIRRGDQSAEEALFGRLRQGLGCIIGHRLGSWDKDAIEDLTSVVLLEVLKGIRTGALREGAKLLGYTRTITIRVVAAEIEARIKARCEEPLVVESVGRYGESPEENLQREDRVAALRKALMTLSPKERDVLTRFYLDEQEPKQIMRDMGLTETQYRLLKSRSKAKLAKARTWLKILPRFLYSPS
jgi:RNA polymerase sigma factor (sigma-70 family)